MKAFISALVLWLFLTPLNIQGQILSEVASRIQLIETFDDKLKKAEPAIFSWTFPDTSDQIMQIQGALGFTLNDSDALTLSLIGEWHQNTKINKEQNVRQLGLNWDYLTPFKPKKTVGWSASGNLKYMRDLQENKQSLIVTGYATPIFFFNSNSPSFMRWLLPDDIIPNGIEHGVFANFLQYSLTPYAGLEYVNFFQAEEESHEGGVLMGHLRANAHLYPLSGIFLEQLGQEHLLDLSADLICRFDLLNSTGESLQSRPLIKLGAGIKFTKTLGPIGKETELKLAYEWVHGADVLKGLEEQQYQQVVLKMKF